MSRYYTQPHFLAGETEAHRRKAHRTKPRPQELEALTLASSSSFPKKKISQVPSYQLLRLNDKGENEDIYWCRAGQAKGFKCKGFQGQEANAKWAWASTKEWWETVTAQVASRSGGDCDSSSGQS